MLHRVPVHRHGEFGHRAGAERVHVVIPELRHSNRDGLVEAFGIDIDGIKDAIRIGEGDPAAGTGHATRYSATFAVCSPYLFPLDSPSSESKNVWASL